MCVMLMTKIDILLTLTITACHFVSRWNAFRVRFGAFRVRFDAFRVRFNAFSVSDFLITNVEAFPGAGCLFFRG